MTNLEAIKIETKRFGLDEDELQLIFLNRNVDAGAEYNRSWKYELSYADAIFKTLSSPTSWSQGDMSESYDRSSLISIASGIYKKYGEDDPFAEKTHTLEYAGNLW